jgi:hypothetical protein
VTRQQMRLVKLAICVAWYAVVITVTGYIR